MPHRTPAWPLLLSIASCACTSSPVADPLAPTRDGGVRAEVEAAADARSPLDVDLELELSPQIPTVVVAHWTTRLERSQLERARVHFHRPDVDEDFVVPVDLGEAGDGAPGPLSFQTPLLGMKPNQQYLVFVELFTQSTHLTSAEVPSVTGSLPPDAPRVTLIDVDPSATYGGFTVACTGPGGGLPWVYIWDRDGEVVWARSIADLGLDACTRARMAYDASAIWVGDLNLIAGDGGNLARLDMTGANAPEVFALPSRHHDFAVLPNGNLLYFRQEQATDAGGDAGLGGTRDVIYEFDPDERVSRFVYDEQSDYAAVIGQAPAHTNYIAFVPHLNAISFSMLAANTIGLVSYPEGRRLATFGGTQSDFDMVWNKQHGHQLRQGQLLVFSNQGADARSVVLAYELDLDRQHAELQWQYTSDDSTPTFGDVKALPNGNLLVTYSNQGVLHELGPDRTLLRRTETSRLGYVEHRASLYGPPPPFSD